MLIRLPLILEYHPKPSRWHRLRDRLAYFPRPSRDAWRALGGAIVVGLIVLFLIYFIEPLLRAAMEH